MIIFLIFLPLRLLSCPHGPRTRATPFSKRGFKRTPLFSPSLPLRLFFLIDFLPPYDASQSLETWVSSSFNSVDIVPFEPFTANFFVARIIPLRRVVPEMELLGAFAKFLLASGAASFHLSGTEMATHGTHHAQTHSTPFPLLPRPQTMWVSRLRRFQTAEVLLPLKDFRERGANLSTLSFSLLPQPWNSTPKTRGLFARRERKMEHSSWPFLAKTRLHWVPGGCANKMETFPEKKQKEEEAGKLTVTEH